MPDQDVVIAITAQTSQMQGELDLVWEKLLPALGSGSLPENQTDQKRLTDLMTALRLPPPAAK
jgi:hypothetical protein